MADLNTIGGLHYEMMRRCYNPKCVSYKDYGARGIKVCEEWHNRDNFRKWCNENGYEKGMRVDRKDSNSDYCPENCFIGKRNCKIHNSKNQLLKKQRIQNKIKKENAGIDCNYSQDKLYKKYQSMHLRCEQKSHPSYKDYGEKGISVCKEWSGKDGYFEFKKWADNNGWKIGLTIDRIDNNRGYSPDNCRWATTTQQNYNRSSNIIYDYNGLKLPLGMIAKIENVKYGMLYNRVRLKNMSIEEALYDIKKGK